MEARNKYWLPTASLPSFVGKALSHGTWSPEMLIDMPTGEIQEFYFLYVPNMRIINVHSHAQILFGQDVVDQIQVLTHAC